MIRFIRIGDQILENYDQFAFYDTIRDHFVDLDGTQVFDSIDDLLIHTNFAQTTDEYQNRLVGLARSANVLERVPDELI